MSPSKIRVVALQTVLVALASSATLLAADPDLPRPPPVPIDDRPPPPVRTAVQTFIRGDVNDDGASDVSDAVATLLALFAGTGELHCVAAGDVNGDLAVDITDPVALLGFLFLDGEPPVQPFPDCGMDVRTHELPCERSESCPVENPVDIEYLDDPQLDSRIATLSSRLARVGHADLVSLRAIGHSEIRGTLRLKPMFSLRENAVTVDEAIIVADELSLFADTVIDLAPDIRHFTILVNRLSVESGATLTWTPQAISPPGERPDVRPPVVSWRTDVEGPGTHETRSEDGGDGLAGVVGRPGFPGTSAPTIEIWACEIDRMPFLDLRGQDGTAGGPGQRGQDGGNGAKGLHAAQGFGFCRRGPGEGGDGGRGGAGGRGGVGGGGGSGAAVILATPDENYLDVLTSSISIDLRGGRGGPGGAGGRGGTGGRGGEQGDPALPFCTRVAGRDGSPGTNGMAGFGGRSGTDGVHGELTANPITLRRWEEAFNRPLIERIEPTRVRVGQGLTITGKNFEQEHRVIFRFTEGGITRVRLAGALAVSGTELRSHVPLGLPIGEAEVRVRTRARALSNPFFITVVPGVSSVEVTGEPTQTPRLGDELTLRGAGLLPGSRVTFREFDLDTTAIGSGADELRVRLPKPAWAYEEPGGEETLAVIAPDGTRSEPVTIRLAHVLDTGFDPARHGFGFRNAFSRSPFRSHLRGLADRNTYMETYGELEVIGAEVSRPTLARLYSAFYRYFFTGDVTLIAGILVIPDVGGPPGLSSGFSMLAADAYWQGASLALTTADTCASPTGCRVPEADERNLTVAMGRILSAENLAAIGEQVARGRRQNQRGLRSIEARIRSLIGREPLDARPSAPVAMTVPSGPFNMWKIASSHGLLPIAIEYPSRPEHDWEAKVLCYNNWYDATEHGADTQYLLFWRNGDELDFVFVDENDGGAHHWPSENGWTVAVLSLEDALLRNISMPFNLFQALLEILG